ncbi:Uncharacterised protein [Orientia tsutsugamushi]|nr:hypothetical protein OTSTA763_2430 [Orientia tsutsugamushi str. TA763]SPP24620.1 Uncharacterised protein [Orientia tsutsugamushi]
MPEIKLNLRENLLRLFRYLSAIILIYLNQFRKKSNIIYLEQKLLYCTLKYYHCINSEQRKAIIKQLLLAQGQLEIKEDLNSIEKKDFDLVNTALDFYICDIMGRFKDVLEPDV